MRYVLKNVRGEYVKHPLVGDTHDAWTTSLKEAASFKSKDEAWRVASCAELGDLHPVCVVRRRKRDAGEAQRRLDALLRELADVAGWQDASWLHAMEHVRNFANNLRASASVAELRAKSAEAVARQFADTLRSLMNASVSEKEIAGALRALDVHEARYGVE